MGQEQHIFLTYDQRSTVDDILVQMEEYIVALTKSNVYGGFSEVERADVAQATRTKFARALQVKQINCYRAYLRTIVHHEFITLVRQRKSVPPSVSLDAREHAQGQFVALVSDPLEIFEQEEAFLERLDMVVRAIMSLSPVQKKVAVCVIRENIDNPALFTAAFKRYNVDITVYQWPEDRVARQTLRASYTHAVTKLARLMHIDGSDFDKPYYPVTRLSA